MSKTILFPSSLLCLIFIACKTPQPCAESPQADCICTRQYDPVCGCNNKTYGNACMAECAGIKTYKKGECPKDTVPKLEGAVWQLNAFAMGPDPQKVPEDINITVKFEDGKVSGRGGCNNYGGGYTVEKSKLRVSQIMSTKMFCDNASNWEARFLQQLEKSQSYAIKGQTLEISCGEPGKLLFHLNWKKPNWN